MMGRERPYPSIAAVAKAMEKASGRAISTTMGEHTFTTLILMSNRSMSTKSSAPHCMLIQMVSIVTSRWPRIVQAPGCSRISCESTCLKLLRSFVDDARETRDDRTTPPVLPGGGVGTHLIYITHL